MKDDGDFTNRTPAIDNLTGQFRSTMQRQTGILMDVHPGLREKVKLRNSTFLGHTRMDNLLKAHSQAMQQASRFDADRARKQPWFKL